jgi:prepilin peptidase CpaA
MQNVSIQAILVILLTLVCAVTDWRHGKVYNALTYPAAAFGLALSAFVDSPPLSSSASGLVACLLFFGALWYAGGLGAGDVKLLAAVGALKGLPFVAHACFYIVCAAAVAGLFLLAWQGRLKPVSKWIVVTLASVVIPGMSAPPLEGGKTSVPFAPFIFVGTCVTAYVEIVSGAPLSF